MFSIAHTVVEFLLIMLFVSGLLIIVSEPIVKVIIGIAGGVFLILFGTFQIQNSFKSDLTEVISQNHHIKTFFLGLAFPGLNPYFIIWRLTVGG